MILYHGSDHIIKFPVYKGGKDDNDYGNGFYLTEYEDRARSWANLNGNQNASYVNKYELDMNTLNMLDLNEFGVLAWIAEVIYHRGASQEMTEIMGAAIIEGYKLNTDCYDVIKGYRADDSYTQVVEAFLQNQINIAEVEKLFYKGSLGNQYFLKSEEAFRHISWIKEYSADSNEDDIKADLKARQDVNKFLSGRGRAILMEGYEVPGITARYALRHMLRYRKDGAYYE